MSSGRLSHLELVVDLRQEQDRVARKDICTLGECQIGSLRHLVDILPETSYGRLVVTWSGLFRDDVLQRCCSLRCYGCRRCVG